jgi:ATP-dependent protease ClpP protease subunit
MSQVQTTLSSNLYYMRLLPVFCILVMSYNCAYAKSIGVPDAGEPVSRVFEVSKYPSVLIPLDVELSDDSLSPVKAKIDQQVKSGAKTVLLRIDSPGGELDAMWHFVQYMEGLQANGVKFQCVADTYAASGAFDILQNCDERLMTNRAILLTHQLSGGVRGTRQEMEDRMEMLERMDRNRLGQEAKRMGMPLDELLKRTAGHNWSMDSEEALAAHAVDAVVDSKDLPPAAKLEKPQETNPFQQLLQKLGGNHRNK